MSDSFVHLDGLSIGFGVAPDMHPVVDGVSLRLPRGEVLALVGESGSGKTLVSKFLLRLLPEQAQVLSGTVTVAGHDVLSLSEKELLSYRGKVAGMVFQEPLTSLNPALQVGYQLSEGLRLHTDMDENAIKAAVLAMLRRVQLPDPEGTLRRYPHEFSGGMRQRIMLASVMLLKPRLLIADEPTTALDVIVQREVLDLMIELVREEGTSLLLITHDLALVSEYADRIAVMEKGKIVEEGVGCDLLNNPQHPYTQRLVAAIPCGSKIEESRHQVAQEPIIVANDVSVVFRKKAGFLKGYTELQAVKSVTVEIARGETVALVGESGSGKSTFGRALLKLLPARSGRISYDGNDITNMSERRLGALRRKMQLVFQDPFSSLDPRMRVNRVIAEGLRGLGLSQTSKDQAVLNILTEVGLGADYLQRYPHELSGGQRQRVCIARAMIMEPDFIVADEPVSALDVTVQAQVLRLLHTLQKKRHFACLFISHDLAVVREVADRIMVMYHGCIVEEGPSAQVFATPIHPYTRALLEAAPHFGTGVRADMLPAVKLPRNLACLDVLDIRENAPTLEQRVWHDVGAGHRVAAVEVGNC